MKRAIFIFALPLLAGCGKPTPTPSPSPKSFVEASAIYDDEVKKLEELRREASEVLKRWSHTDDPVAKESLDKKYDECCALRDAQSVTVSKALKAKEDAKH